MQRDLSPIQSTSLRERVVSQIRTAIIEGRLKPGDHIKEQWLTEQLNVSRTPIREALILLEREGLVYSIPYRGSFVRDFTVQDVDMIFSMRTMLENFAADLVLPTFSDEDRDHLQTLIDEQAKYIEANDFEHVRSADVAFHQYLIQRAEHPLLERSWDEIAAQIAALLFIRAEAIQTFDEYLAIRDHGAILEAYASGDVQRVYAENRRIYGRAAKECRFAVEHFQTKEDA